MKIKSVDCLPDYKIKISFDDLTVKICNLKPFLKSSGLRCFFLNQELFKKIKITEDGLSWPDDYLVIRSESLYNGAPWLPVENYIEPVPAKSGLIGLLKKLGR